MNETIDCIAVLPFEIRNDLQPSEEFLSDYLSLDLGKEGFQGLLGPRELRKELKKKNIVLPPRVDMLWAKEVGRQINVQGVVYGNISRIPIQGSNPKFEKNPKVLLDVDVHFLDLSAQSIAWTFGTREIIFSEDYATKLSDVSERMARSLLGPRLVAEKRGTSSCWTKVPIQTTIAEVSKSGKPASLKIAPAAKAKLTSGQVSILKKMGEKKTIILDASFFEGRTARFTKAAIPFLRNLEGLMASKVGPDRVVIHSHIDATANSAADLEASQYRAEAIESYLQSLGIEAKRIKVRSYGGSKPKIPNLNEKARKINRRVEIEAEFAEKE